MMTWVYSVSARDSISISSSWAAPRMPPSGFLISWARFLISSLVACACSSARSSRSWRVCCSISTTSKTTLREPSIWLTITRTGSVSPWVAPGRLSCASSRLVEKALLLTAATVLLSTRASANQSKAEPRDMLRRDSPSAFSNDELAKMHSPSGVDHGDHRRQQVERRVARRIVGARRRGGGRAGGRHNGRSGAAGSFWSSRRMAAMSASLRVIAALSCPTRSTYFW